MRPATCCFFLVLAACSSTDGGVSQRSYTPCNGEPTSCALASRTGGSGGDGCLCTYYCMSDRDCPAPESGTAVAICRPFGDYIVNGHTADCRLPCDSSTVCPDGMFCSGGDCWATISP
jgi:hypothetical protein